MKNTTKNLLRVY